MTTSTAPDRPISSRRRGPLHSGVAQLAEQLTVNQWVVGSSPTPGASGRSTAYGFHVSETLSQPRVHPRGCDLPPPCYEVDDAEETCRLDGEERMSYGPLTPTDSALRWEPGVVPPIIRGSDRTARVRMNVVVISNLTWTPLGSVLGGNSLRVLEVGSLATGLADPASPCHHPGTDAVVVHVDGEELLESESDAEAFLIDRISEFADTRVGVWVILNTLRVDRLGPASYADACRGGFSPTASSPSGIGRSSISRAAMRTSMVMDLPAVFGELGRSGVVNRNYWYLGRHQVHDLGVRRAGRTSHQSSQRCRRPRPEAPSHGSRQHVVGWRPRRRRAIRCGGFGRRGRQMLPRPPTGDRSARQVGSAAGHRIEERRVPGEGDVRGTPAPRPPLG